MRTAEALRRESRVSTTRVELAVRRLSRLLRWASIVERHRQCVVAVFGKMIDDHERGCVRCDTEGKLTEHATPWAWQVVDNLRLAARCEGGEWAELVADAPRRLFCDPELLADACPSTCSSCAAASGRWAYHRFAKWL